MTDASVNRACRREWLLERLWLADVCVGMGIWLYYARKGSSGAR